MFFSAALSDLREHIPTSKFGAALRHTGGVAQRRRDVQHHDLSVEMVGQCRSLMNHAQRRIREINRKKNFLDIQHRARRFGFYGTLLISCAGDGSCEASQPPPSASINPPLAVIC